MDGPKGNHSAASAVERALDALTRRRRDATSRELRLVELEHTVRALAVENQRLRRALRALELKLDPDARGIAAAVSPGAADGRRTGADRI